MLSCLQWNFLPILGFRSPYRSSSSSFSAVSNHEDCCWKATTVSFMQRRDGSNRPLDWTVKQTRPLIKIRTLLGAAQLLPKHCLSRLLCLQYWPYLKQTLHGAACCWSSLRYNTPIYFVEVTLHQICTLSALIRLSADCHLKKKNGTTHRGPL